MGGDKIIAPASVKRRQSSLTPSYIWMEIVLHSSTYRALSEQPKKAEWVVTN